MVLWREKKIGNSENSALCTKLKEYLSSDPSLGALQCVTETGEALKLLKERKKNAKTVVLTNGGDKGSWFVDQIRNELHLSCPILVFCGNVTYHSGWVSNFEEVVLTTSSSEVLEFVKKYIKVT